MVRKDIPSTQYSSSSTPLLTLLRFSTYPMLAYLSRFIPSTERLYTHLHLHLGSGDENSSCGDELSSSDDELSFISDESSLVY